MELQLKIWEKYKIANLVDSLLGRVATPSGSWWPGREESGTFCSLHKNYTTAETINSYLITGLNWVGFMPLMAGGSEAGLGRLCSGGAEYPLEWLDREPADGIPRF